MIYIFPLLACILGIFEFDINHHYKFRKILWNFLFLYCVTIIGLRFHVGGDTISYVYDYRRILPLTNYTWDSFIGDYYQPLYLLLCVACKWVHPDFTLFQVIHSTILNIIIFSFIWKNTKYKFTGLFFYLFLYFLYFNTEIMRESLAIGMFLLGSKYLIAKRYSVYYLFVILSIGFHTSAMILLILPLFMNIRFNKNFIIIAIVYVLFIYLIRNQLDFLSNLENLSAKKVAKYASDFETGAMNKNWIIYRVVKYTILPFILLIFQKVILKRNISFEPFICIYILFGIGVVFYQIIFERFTNYFMPFYGIFLSNIVGQSYRSNSINLKIIRNFVIASVIIVNGYYYKAGDNWKMWIPYYSVFDPHINRFRELNFGHI